MRVTVVVVVAIDGIGYGGAGVVRLEAASSSQQQPAAASSLLKRFWDFGGSGFRTPDDSYIEKDIKSNVKTIQKQ